MISRTAAKTGRSRAVLWAIAIVVASLGAPAPPAAAHQTPVPGRPDSGRAAPDMPDLRRLQSSLRELGHYHGPIDGRLTAATTAAIRRFQGSAGLPMDGRLTAETVIALETLRDARAVVERLDRSRSADQAVARRALAGRPETRALVDGSAPEQPAAPALCAPAQSLPCLLTAAAAAARSVAPGPKRDWALREVAEAWSRAGEVAAARASLTALSDPRLKLAGLTDMAVALAEGRRVPAALEIASTLPDPTRRLEAWLNIGEALAAGPHAAAVARILDELETAIGAGSGSAEPVPLLARMAVIAARTDQHDRSRRLLSRAGQAAASGDPGLARDRALHALAIAHSDLGKTAAAAALLARITSDSLRTAAGAAIATAAASGGDMALARRLAAALTDPGVGSRVHIHIAAAEAGMLSAERAQATLADAAGRLPEIDRDYVRDAVLVELTGAHLALAKRSGRREQVDEALGLATGIGDHRLRATALWQLADACGRLCPASAAGPLRIAAEAATAQIPDPVARVWVLAGVAERRAATGDVAGAGIAFHQAYRLTVELAAPWGQARALARLATARIAIDEAADTAAVRP